MLEIFRKIIHIAVKFSKEKVLSDQIAPFNFNLENVQRSALFSLFDEVQSGFSNSPLKRLIIISRLPITQGKTKHRTI